MRAWSEKIELLLRQGWTLEQIAESLVTSKKTVADVWAGNASRLSPGQANALEIMHRVALFNEIRAAVHDEDDE